MGTIMSVGLGVASGPGLLVVTGASLAADAPTLVGDRIDHHLDRRATWVDSHGHGRLAQRLDRDGGQIASQLDRRDDHAESRRDRRGDGIDRRWNRRR